MTRLELVGEQPAGSAGPGSQPGADAADAGAAGEANAPGAMAREALVVLFASVLERHQRRLQAREDDLRRAGKPAPFIVDALAKERARLRPKLADECATAITLLERMYGARLREEALLESASAVERGEDPKAVAVRLLPAPKGEAHVAVG
jgi:hypothetical protein